MCSGPSGVCQCREHVVGKACQRPENNYYFPDLHHMRYEIEDGTTPHGRALRFGFDPLEFPEFSWRGYAQMTSVQDYLVLLPRDYYEAPSLRLPVELRLRLRVPQVGHYMVVVEYSTEVDQPSEADVLMWSPGAVLAGQVNVYSCKYSILCRSAVTDGRGRLAVYELLADADVQLKARMARFLLVRFCFDR
ncbi:Laminin subunit alpha-3 [Camelus dromedarius]|uniref:Laminin subunit alpha-3 n=1 Tax=Camelus dromedarius TaxID=9838 RepID=A0A5N4CI16_CAMDR|nr:Laminin subunit alpha-3 [Camelus dromedarius]